MLVASTVLAAVAALVAAAFAFLAWRNAGSATRREAPLHPELVARLMLMERILGEAPRDIRADVAAFKNELGQALAIHTQQLETRLGRFEQAQGGHLSGLRGESAEGRKTFEEALDRHVQGFSHTQTSRLAETNLAMRTLRESVETLQARAQAEQKAALESIAQKLEALNAGAAERQEAMRATLAASLETLRAGNEVKLEEMRATVDEKLTGTLNERLGENFKAVSERLEAVHKGLGEMQSLATGVGDLKRVLTNVKARGGWGEMQLGGLLQDMLTPEQYAAQVGVRPGSSERVDFAVRLPGRGEAAQIWLPIDAKFPQEDYERLHVAQEQGLIEEIEARSKELERTVRLQAKSVGAKYVCPPHTTDFAILYLATEGLFAEVIRRPGLIQELQSQHRVMVTGPTTLAAILNSLQMGFRSLAVEKRSSDVWRVLGEAKAEFAKYGVVWEKLGKKLEEAKTLHDDVSVRTRAVDRKLKGVEVLEAPPTPALDGARLSAVVALPPPGAEEAA